MRISVGRIINWLAFGLLVLLLLVSGSVVGGLLWLRTQWGGDFIRGQVETQLGKLVKGEVRLGGVGGDIVSGIVLEDFALIGEDGVALVDVERLVVDYPLAPLFDRRIVLGRVRLENADVHVVRYPDGRWNFRTLFEARPPRPPDAPPSWGSFIEIDRIEFVDTDVRVDLSGDEWPVFDWSQNEFQNLNGGLGLRLVSQARRNPERRFVARDLAVATTSPTLSFQRIDGTVTWTDAGLEIDGFEVETENSSVRADGELDTTGEAGFEIEFDAPRVDFEEVRRFVSALRLDGSASVEGRVTGSPSDLVVEMDEARVETPASVVDVSGTVRRLTDPVLALDLDLERLAADDVRRYWEGYPFEPPLAGAVRIEGPPREMEISASLQSPSGALTVDGMVGAGRGPLRYNVSATSSDLDIGALIGKPGVDVVLSGGYVIEGVGTGPEELDARLVAGLAESRIFWWDVVEGETNGRLLGRTYTADSLRVEMDNGVVRGAGTFGLAADGEMRADLQVTTSDLAELWPALTMVSGTTQATAEIRGTYQSFDVSGDVVGEDLALGAVSAERFTGRVELDDVGQTLAMRAQGTLDGLRSAGLVSDTADVALSYRDGSMEIDGVLHYLDESRTTVSGVTQFGPAATTFTLTGLGHESPEGSWVMSQGSQLVVGAGMVRFDGFEVVGGDQRVRAQGSLPLDGGVAGLDIEVTDLDLAELARLSGQPTGDWVGRLSATARIEGRREDPDIALRGVVSPGEIRSVRFHRIEGEVRYVDRRAAVDVTVTTPTEGHDVVMTGQIPIDLALVTGVDRIPDRAIDLQVRGVNTDLSLLQAFIPGLSDLSGPIDLVVDVTGTTDSPVFEGRASVREGRFRIPATGMRYRDISGSVSFDNDEVRIERLGGTDGSGGTFEAGGSIAMENLRLGELDLELGIRGLQVVDQRRQFVQVDGAIRIDGTTQSPRITGTVAVDEAIYRLPERSKKRVINLDQATVYVEIPGVADVARQRSPSLWTRTRLDLIVEVTDDAILTSENARVEIEGDLSLFKGEGTDVPTFSGTLNVRRGFYREFGQRFTIQEGEVFFFGTPDLNPGLHIVAVRTVPNVPNAGDVEIRIVLGGRLKSPTIDLQSTPEFDKSEIVSLALFGTPDPSTGEREQFQQAVSGAAFQLTGGVQDALAREVGLDVVEVSQRGEETGETATLFRVGKFITPDVYVTVEQEVGGQEDRQAVGIRYQVSPLFSLQATAGTEQTALDLFWEFGY